MRISPTGIDSGFTLLELVLVVAMVGLLFGVALPDWQGRRTETSLRLASSQLAQLCRYGLSFAASQGQSLQLLWDGQAFSLTLEDPAEVLEKYSIPPPIEYYGPDSVSLPLDPEVQEECILSLELAGRQYTVSINAEGVVTSLPGGSGHG